MHWPGRTVDARALGRRTIIELSIAIGQRIEMSHGGIHLVIEHDIPMFGLEPERALECLENQGVVQMYRLRTEIELKRRQRRRQVLLPEITVEPLLTVGGQFEEVQCRHLTEQKLHVRVGHVHEDRESQSSELGERGEMAVIDVHGERGFERAQVRHASGDALQCGLVEYVIVEVEMLDGREELAFEESVESTAEMQPME